MGVREDAKEHFLRLQNEMTTVASVGAGVTPQLGATPATNPKKGKRCPKCKDMFSPKCKCPNVKAEEHNES